MELVLRGMWCLVTYWTNRANLTNPLTREPNDAVFARPHFSQRISMLLADDGTPLTTNLLLTVPHDPTTQRETFFEYYSFLFSFPMPLLLLLPERVLCGVLIE